MTTKEFKDRMTAGGDLHKETQDALDANRLNREQLEDEEFDRLGAQIEHHPIRTARIRRG